MGLIRWKITLSIMLMLILLSACGINSPITDNLDENLMATWRENDSDYHFMTFLENGQGFNTSCLGGECRNERYFRWETEGNRLKLSFYFLTTSPVLEIWGYELVDGRLYFDDSDGWLEKAERPLLEPTFDLDDFSNE